MPDEIVFKLKAELRKMRKGDLLRMILSQKERKCLLGGICPFLLEYQRILFCVSEILGQGCQMERLHFNQKAQGEGEHSQKPKTAPGARWLPGFRRSDRGLKGEEHEG
jgi:hypothetical protein